MYQDDVIIIIIIIVVVLSSGVVVVNGLAGPSSARPALRLPSAGVVVRQRRAQR